jgi:phosphotransferase system enzyme I (PtsI)
MSRKLKGVSAAPGIAIAPIVHFHTNLELIPTREITEDEVKEECDRLEAAVMSASRSILFLRHEMAQSLSEHDSKIYDVQLNLLHDKTFKSDLETEVANNLINAEVAVQRVIARYEAVFEKANDAMLRERAADIRDVGRQLLTAVLDKERSVYMPGGQDYIFAADEFLPSDAGVIDRDHIKGIVTVRGGKYSHGAILARSLGIPSLVGVEDVLVRARSGTKVILDGESGVLVINPDNKTLGTYDQILKDRDEANRRVFEVSFAPSVTPDGVELSLMANSAGVHDLRHVDMALFSGVGLFRTEFAFMERHQFPTEDEQVKMYEAAMASAAGKPVTFRTLDIGGDKPLPYFRTPDERNAVLGWRGLRISLSWPDIFYTQVRAILRASASGHARILLPMVTTLDEVRTCRNVLTQMLRDLKESKIPHDEDIEMGAMVEVPAVAHVLDHILPYIDFVSVGTNDLVQYLLAVDRDNPRVASLYDPYHPAVLRVLRHIAMVGNAANKPVAICGEIAGDHYFTPLLMGMGYRELSMAPVFLPRVKLMVRSFEITEAEKITDEAFKLSTAAEVRELVAERGRAAWSGFLSEGKPRRSRG